MKLEAKLDIKKIPAMVNVAAELSESDCNLIAKRVLDDYKMDLASRSGWEEKMKSALELALQVVKEKSFPWPGAANIKFPLITIAALNFHARMYPAMIPGPDVVKCQTYGDDPDGVKSKRAERVEDHMNYQLIEEDEGWEDAHDRVLITAPIVGCAFKKIFFDTEAGHKVAEFVMAKDLVIPYYARSLESASRMTHIVPMYYNEMLSNEIQGIYCEDVSDGRPVPTGQDKLDEVRDSVQGVVRPLDDHDTPYDMLEQHRWLDLDGDGFAEPYIVTVRRDNGRLARIVARFGSRDVKWFNGRIIRIRAHQYFQKYSFIPSPDGGIYDLGFGVFLGPLNESINTLINQLVDAGTLANSAGGFLGRGAKFRSGDNSFKPFEWKRVDSTGDDLRKNIVPLTTRDPSQVLFSLLELLINYGERIAGATDPQVGINPGQNTPAETSRNTLAEGQRVFKGIYKRLHRNLKEELRKHYRMNQLYLDQEESSYWDASGLEKKILMADYFPDEKTICPTSDPNMVSDQEALGQAVALKQASAVTPGYDRVEVEKRFLKALKVVGADAVFPGPEKMPPPPNYKLQIEQMKVQAKREEMTAKMRMAAFELLGEVELNQAKIQELRAKAAKHLAEAKGVESGHQIALLEAQIGAAKAHQDSLLRSAKLILDGINQMKDGGQDGGEGNAGGGRVPGMAGSPGHAALQAVAGGAGGGGEAGMV